MLEDALINLSPISFFQIRMDCPFKVKTQLPDTSALCNETAFAEISMSWSDEGLTFYVLSKRPFHYPSIYKGDSFEVMIDTRDMKTASFNTRFCHHFFCFPKETDEGVVAGEITRFRTEDTHELCDPKELKVHSEFFRKGYSCEFFIPKSCLHGYEPGQFDRLGLTYCLNSFQGGQQYFAVSGSDYQIDQQPSLWATARLVR